MIKIYRVQSLIPFFRVGFCLLIYLSPLNLSFAAPDSAMDFRVARVCNSTQNCETMVVGSGKIQIDTYKNFIKKTSQLNSRMTVLLDGYGDDFEAGINLGNAIRDKYFNTQVGVLSDTPNKIMSGKQLSYPINPGNCVSACLVAFLGGVSRTLDIKDIIGFYGGINGASQKNTQSLKEYIDEMGESDRILDFLLPNTNEELQRIPYSSAKQLNIDNQNEIVLMPWVLKTTSNKTPVAVISEKQSSGDLSLTIGISRIGDAINPKENLQLILFIKPIKGRFNFNQIDSVLNSKSTEIQLKNQKHAIIAKVIEPWSINQDGLQIIASIPTKSLEILSSEPKFQLIIELPPNLNNAQNFTTFGTQGLKKLIARITKL
jgi:hypothetical protein